MSVPKKVLETFIQNFNIPKAKSKLSAENAGGRLFPSRNTKNDAASNFRADQGSPYTNDPDTFSVNVQANANASNTSVRRFAEKNPDKKLFAFPMKKDDTDEDVKNKMIDAAKSGGYL
ncbi:hypothetical protein ASPZODRAFT_1032218 [Penicilliopsis zonata CBS 506.65]|uniref:Uncharacterized protein n=1 Tax=Penicilliopsis zonata CBS 506.65 TaxID=1073090 RepID=A0A1L9SRL4_9EURO|nr:hypothetical protein ASPZODRAFT_1032218 [Penicilliopsis zonata CBS 506.65]OJJ49808.1 hypothetical protein ASPZODRAFT_1032218 [Penicilliopsis zonata CBS 506.65]